MSSEPARKGGCALALGLLLVAAGSVLLAANVFGFPAWSFWSRALTWFGRYWPVILIVWGASKVTTRLRYPGRAQVTAGEVLLLIFLVLVGLSIHSAQVAVSELDLDEAFDWMLPPTEYGPAQRFSAEERFALAAGAALNVENDRGAVTVSGWDEPDVKVVVTKRIYRRSEEEARRVADEIRLEFQPAEGDSPARLATRVADERERSRAETDLEVFLPHTAPVTVANGRGPLRVSGLRAAVGLASAYDLIEVEDIEGSVNLDGRHGPVRIASVRGDVEARSRYDTLSIREVSGNVVAEAANGELTVEDVSGTARLENRDSRVYAARIGGDLTIEAARADIRVEDARAAVAIETSYGSVLAQGVSGRLSIEGRNSEIEVRDIKGDLELSNRYRPVVVAGVGGGVVLEAEQCELRLSDIAGPVRISSSYQPIELEGFRSSVEVETQHAAVTLAAAAIGGEVRVATSYGPVRLTLPEGGSFRVEATTTNGQIRSDFASGAWERRSDPKSREERLTGSVGSGAVPITLTTTHGNIEILKAPAAEVEEGPRARR